jgi:hypothetical protein
MMTFNQGLKMSQTTAVGDAPSIYKIVYRSHMIRQTDARFHADIERILDVSREWNAANNITGALLLTGTGYAQVLEGSAHDVKSLFGHIACDSRHQGVELMYHESHEERDFGNWAMTIVRMPDQSDIELASTAYQRNISISNGAEDILMMLRWLLYKKVH